MPKPILGLKLNYLATKMQIYFNLFGRISPYPSNTVWNFNIQFPPNNDSETLRSTRYYDIDDDTLSLEIANSIQQSIQAHPSLVSSHFKSILSPCLCYVSNGCVGGVGVCGLEAASYSPSTHPLFIRTHISSSTRSLPLF